MMVQLRIVLLELQPNFWRRVVLPNCPLASLLRVVARVFQGEEHDAMLAGDDWQCLINGMRMNLSEGEFRSHMPDTQTLDLHTALRIGEDGQIGKFRLIYQGRWTFLTVVSNVADADQQQAACLGGWGIPLPLSQSPERVTQRHRLFVRDSLLEESERVSGEIAELERELNATGRGSRRWEEQWCRLRGEDEWADQLAERRERHEAKIWRLERRLPEINRLRDLATEGLSEQPAGTVEWEAMEFSFFFSVT